VRAELTAVEITAASPTGGALRARLDGPGPATVGPYLVEVGEVEGGASEAGGAAEAGRLRWSVANRGDRAAAPGHVRLLFRLVDAPEPLGMFSHGYQSWSPSRMLTFGVDRDPSTVEGCFRFVRDVYLGDPTRVADPEELRSSLVTVLGPVAGSERGAASGAASPERPLLLAGFLGGHDHDGFLRLRRGPDGAAELVVEAFLGGAELPPGSRRSLHDIVLRRGGEAAPLLERWAAEVGASGGARLDTPYQVGWCSWYHYFHDVTEQAVRSNLSRAADWPFAVFQVDDGYQAHIGDWLVTNDRFPSALSALAATIAAEGRRPGIWLAPFLASPNSAVAAAHPEWMVGDPVGQGPRMSWFNPPWGGTMWGLDTTRPEVLEHVASTAASLVAAGFTYLKLDFTMAPGLEGRFADPTRTPAERVRAGYEAVRRGAGDDAFLLGCGAPLGPCVGLVDGMRIGPDVAPTWELDERDGVLPGLSEVQPATAHAYRATMARSFQHRRLWSNDPDCLMLRTDETSLSAEAMRTWAHIVALSGGMALVSDDLTLLGGEARALLDEVVTLGLRSDEQARGGPPARCGDLLADRGPTRLAAVGHEIVVDPASGASQRRPPG
jgi:alpha-galactosidase